MLDPAREVGRKKLSASSFYAVSACFAFVCQLALIDFTEINTTSQGEGLLITRSTSNLPQCQIRKLTTSEIVAGERKRYMWDAFQWTVEKHKNLIKLCTIDPPHEGRYYYDTD